MASIPKRFGVLGSGEVGQVLAKGLAANGYDVRIGTRTPGKLEQILQEHRDSRGEFPGGHGMGRTTWPGSW